MSVVPTNVCPVGHTAMQAKFSSSGPEQVNFIISLLKIRRKSPKEFLLTEQNSYCHTGTTCDQAFKKCPWDIISYGRPRSLQLPII